MRFGDLAQGRERDVRAALSGQREARQDQEGAAEGEQDVGQRVWLGALAAQDQEVGADGQGLPGGEEVEAVLGDDQHREAGIHQHGRGIKAEPPAPGLVTGQQDQRAADQDDQRRRSVCSGSYAG